jgi:phage tail sheath gpL-like
MKNRIQADALLQSKFGVFFEPVKQRRFVRVVKGIYDFICKPDISVNGINRLSELLAQKLNAKGKRGAVCFRGKNAAFRAHTIV